MDDQVETVPVSFEVLGVEPVNGTGRLIGLATVQVELGGVELIPAVVCRDSLGLKRSRRT